MSGRSRDDEVIQQIIELLNKLKDSALINNDQELIDTIERIKFDVYHLETY